MLPNENAFLSSKSTKYFSVFSPLQMHIMDVQMSNPMQKVINAQGVRGGGGFFSENWSKRRGGKWTPFPRKQWYVKFCGSLRKSQRKAFQGLGYRHIQKLQKTNGEGKAKEQKQLKHHKTTMLPYLLTSLPQHIGSGWHLFASVKAGMSTWETQCPKLLWWETVKKKVPNHYQAHWREKKKRINKPLALRGICSLVAFVDSPVKKKGGVQLAGVAYRHT